MAKIGIVLATYNGEKYLSQMLDSLVAQTRKADFIIAVDDGSKDNTPAILKSSGISATAIMRQRFNSSSRSR